MQDVGKYMLTIIVFLSPYFYRKTFVLKDYCKTNDWSDPMKPDTIDYLIQLEEKLIAGKKAVTNIESFYMNLLASWCRKIDSSDPALREFISRDILARMVFEVVKLGKRIAVICSIHTHAEFIQKNCRLCVWRE